MFSLFMKILQIFYSNYSKMFMNNILFPITVYDASAKIPSGILSGNVNQFGDFDQCLRVNDQKWGVKGQYCLTYVEMKLPSNANEKLKYVFDLMHSHSAFRSRLEDVSISIILNTNIKFESNNKKCFFNKTIL